MGFISQIQRLRKDQSGMTLIDLSIFLMVLGLLTVPLIKVYDGWKYSKARGITDNNIASINKAIADYYFDNRRYPCPAVATDAPNSANFGRENCAGTAIPGNMHDGMVPFVTLKIPADMALDGWSNRIRYVVSTQMVPPIAPPVATFPVTGITLQRFSPVSCNGTLNAPQLNTQIVLVSHGPKGVGAFSSNGTLVQACPGGATPPLEAENCDGDAVFFDDICARNDREGPNYYDDIIYSDDTVPSRIWMYSTSPAADPTDIVSTMQRVGINNPNPFGGGPDMGVDVLGNVMSGDGTVANPGAIVSDALCDVNGANCFTPELIGGVATTRNDCTKNPGQGIGMRGIWGGTEAGDARTGARVRCQSSYLPAAATTCPANKYAIGFSGGRIVCQP